MQLPQETRDALLDSELRDARDEAYEPIAHMNRKERRTKMGRIMQAACEARLKDSVLKILRADAERNGQLNG